MYKVSEKSILIGASELRAGIEAILRAAKDNVVVIQKRNKPLAVLLSEKKYREIQALVELAEDIILGQIAKERFESTDISDYIDLEDI